MRIAPLDGNIAHRSAQQSPPGCHQHRLIAFAHQGGADQLAVAPLGADRNDALSRPSLARKFAHLGALAETLGGGLQYPGAVFLSMHDQGRHNAVLPLQLLADHAGGGAAHGTHGGLGKARRAAIAGQQDDVAAAIGNCRLHQPILPLEAQGVNAGAADIRKCVQAGLLHPALAGGHEHEPAVVEGIHRQHRIHALAFLQPRQQIGDRQTTGFAALRGNLERPEPENPRAVGKTKQGGMGMADEKLVDEVLLAHRGATLAPSAPSLRAKRFQLLRLHIAAPGKRNQQLAPRNQILIGRARVIGDDFGAALIAVFFAKLVQLVAHHFQQPVGIAQDFGQFLHPPEQIGIFLEDRLLLQTRQALQAEFQYRPRLAPAQPVAPVA